MRKVLALLLSLVMTLSLLVPATWAEEKPAAGYQLPASLKGKTVILHTNDVHGAIDKYAKVAALRNECYDRGASAVVLLMPVTSAKALPTSASARALPLWS